MATRPNHLTACIAFALSLATADAAQGPAHAGRPSKLQQLQAMHVARAPWVPAPKPTSPPHIWAVDNCADDGGPNTLRSAIAAAGDGDVIDLGQLNCSTITLTTGQGAAYLAITQPNLELRGPTPPHAPLTIDGDFLDSVIRHAGTGTLTLQDLTITRGKYQLAAGAYGGCIYSAGAVALAGTTVDSCKVGSSGGYNVAHGGGIHARGLSMQNSTISRSYAGATDFLARGGGAYVNGDVDIRNSTITSNNAITGGVYGSAAGGIFVHGNASIDSSTFSTNSADYIAAIAAIGTTYTVTISSSTVSGNRTNGYGAIYSSNAVDLRNSTVAFNRSSNSNSAAGTFIRNTLTTNSSIIAANTTGGLASDVDALAIGGANNLIIASTVLLPNTITECPRLEPLADNGGPTRTHALRSDSPAIDQGSAPGVATDQRGLTRVIGAAADIGAVERQGEPAERILTSAFESPPYCDF